MSSDVASESIKVSTVGAPESHFTDINSTLVSLRNEEKFCDLAFVCHSSDDESSKPKVVYAHQALFQPHSKLIQELFEISHRKQLSDRIYITLVEVNELAVEKLIDYLYLGKTDVSKAIEAEIKDIILILNLDLKLETETPSTEPDQPPEVVDVEAEVPAKRAKTPEPDQKAPEHELVVEQTRHEEDSRNSSAEPEPPENVSDQDGKNLPKKALNPLFDIIGSKNGTPQKRRLPENEKKTTLKASKKARQEDDSSDSDTEAVNARKKEIDVEPAKIVNVASDSESEIEVEVKRKPGPKRKTGPRPASVQAAREKSVEKETTTSSNDFSVPGTTHHDSVNFCPVCGKIFVSKQAHESHMAEEHQENTSSPEVTPHKGESHERRKPGPASRKAGPASKKQPKKLDDANETKEKVHGENGAKPDVKKDEKSHEEKKTDEEKKEKKVDERKEKRTEEEKKEKRSDGEKKEKRTDEEKKEKRSDGEKKEKRTDVEKKEKRKEGEKKEKHTEGEHKEKDKKSDLPKKKSIGPKSKTRPGPASKTKDQGEIPPGNKRPTVSVFSSDEESNSSSKLVPVKQIKEFLIALESEDDEPSSPKLSKLPAKSTPIAKKPKIRLSLGGDGHSEKKSGRLSLGSTSGAPRKCKFCSDIFDKPANLKNHVLNHFKDKFYAVLPKSTPYLCPLCNAPNRDKITLMRHYAFSHKKVLDYCTEADLAGESVEPGHDYSPAVKKSSTKSVSNDKAKSKALLSSDSSDNDSDVGRKKSKKLNGSKHVAAHFSDSGSERDFKTKSLVKDSTGEKKHSHAKHFLDSD